MQTLPQLKPRGMFDSFLDISSSFNIYDADSITREIFVYEGQESPNSVYFATGYMKCKGGDTLHVQFETPQGVRVDLAEYTSFADIRYMEAYDENKVYITGSNVGNQRTYTVPDGASYVRFTFYLGFLSNASDIMIFPSSDTSIVSYTAYDEKNVCVKKSCLPVTEIKAFLPGEICVAVGRTIEIYNSQVCRMPRTIILSGSVRSAKLCSASSVLLVFPIMSGLTPLSLKFMTMKTLCVGAALRL